jgi:hypothetical protein
MNLFNPKGQKNLAVELGKVNYTKNTTTEESERSVNKIRSIFNDEGGKGKIRNNDLQQKTEAV